MKFKIGLLAFFTCIFIFAFVFKSEDLGVTAGKKHDVEHVAVIKQQIERKEIESEKDAVCTSEPTTTLSKVREVILLGESNVQIWKLKESFKDNPLALQKKIISTVDFKSRELYTIAFFYLAKECSQMSISSLPNSKEALQQFKLNQCDSLPEHLLQEPFLILDDIIFANSLLAKTHYLTNAIKLSDYYKNSTGLEQSTHLKKILDRAEKVGFEAAGAGVREATYAMSRAYREGLFGVMDPVKAFEYLLQLSKFEHSDEFRNVMSETKKQVKGSGINKIEKLEKECIFSRNVIANPFNL